MMRRPGLFAVVFRLVVVVSVTAVVAFGQRASGTVKTGKVDLKSASQLAFGPDGVLFIGDSLRGTVFAINTEDTKPAASPVTIDIQRVNEKIAALLGTASPPNPADRWT